MKVIPDWSIPEGRKKTDGDRVRIHPYKYIRYVQKKLGLDKAMQVAKLIVKKKYDKKFDEMPIQQPNES